LAQGFLVTLIGDLSKVAGKLQTHPLARTDCAVVFLIQPIEKVIDRHTQNLSDLEQSAGRHAIDTAFVFVRLLIGHPDKSASCCCVKPSMMRRSRMRAPTYRSMSWVRPEDRREGEAVDGGPPSALRVSPNP